MYPSHFSTITFLSSSLPLSPSLSPSSILITILYLHHHPLSSSPSSNLITILYPHHHPLSSSPSSSPSSILIIHNSTGKLFRDNDLNNLNNDIISDSGLNYTGGGAQGTHSRHGSFLQTAGGGVGVGMGVGVHASMGDPGGASSLSLGQVKEEVE